MEHRESDGERWIRFVEAHDAKVGDVTATAPLPGECPTCRAALELRYQPFRWVDVATGEPHECGGRRRRRARS